MYLLATIWAAGAVTQFRTPDSLNSINSAFAAVDSVAAGFKALSAADRGLEVPLAASPPRALAELRDALVAAGGGTLAGNETAGANDTAAPPETVGTLAPETEPEPTSTPPENDIETEPAEEPTSTPPSLAEASPNVTSAGLELLPGRNWTLQHATANANATAAAVNGTVRPAETLAEVRANATDAARANATDPVRGAAKVWAAIGALNGAVASHAGPQGLRAARRRPPPVAFVEQGQPGWDDLERPTHHVSAWVPVSIVGGVFGSYGLWRWLCGPKTADDVI